MKVEEEWQSKTNVYVFTRENIFQLFSHSGLLERPSFVLRAKNGQFLFPKIIFLSFEINIGQILVGELNMNLAQGTKIDRNKTEINLESILRYSIGGIRHYLVFKSKSPQ